MPNQKIFNPHLIFVNLYKHAKNEVVSSICFGEIVRLKIMQFDCLRAFWPISQGQDFSQIKDLCRNATNNIHFHYRINSVINSMAKFFFELNLIFSPFPQFLGQKKFFLKIGLSWVTS